MQRLIAFAWFAVLTTVVTLLSVPESRDVFKTLTQTHPYVMGFFKIAVLGTMGELLGGRIVTGRWRLTGIRLPQRILVWGFLGVVFTAVFPLFSFGVDGLLAAGLIPGAGSALATAFWKSLFLNLIFGFPMMVFHRITDTLIDRGEFIGVWSLAEVTRSIDWRNMYRIVGGACLWFWIPAHTITFLLPPEFRVVSAALLAVILGAILGFAKKRAQSATVQSSCSASTEQRPSISAHSSSWAAVNQESRSRRLPVIQRREMSSLTLRPFRHQPDSRGSSQVNSPPCRCRVEFARWIRTRLFSSRKASVFWCH